MNTNENTTSNDNGRTLHSMNIADNTLVLILAGGRGTRLHEMTDRRSKPAVYFGGNWRIIDFTLSNCLNSNLKKIGVLTQYEAHSLLRHLQHAWSFLPRDGGYGAALSLATLFIVVNLPCIALWAVVGDRLRVRLSEPRTLRLFNGVMALLLAATALWILADELLPR